MNPEHDTTRGEKWKQLSEAERYKIEGLLEAGQAVRDIARILSRDRRTIEREIKRGTVQQRRENRYASRNPAVKDYWDEWVYKADAGQRVHEERATNKGRGLKIGHDHALAAYLEQRVGKDRFSPDAAIGAIRAQGLIFKVQLCTKTVYNMIARGDFLRLTNEDLPVKRSKKKRKHHRARQVALNNRKGRSIEERPSVANEREEVGHWEMDLVVGSGKACLLVMTERLSRKELLVKLPDKRQDSVVKALDKIERKYRHHFGEVFKTITMDNGSEFLDYKRMEASILHEGNRTSCYYAHPYSAWERGSNENANKLIRRFVPKGTDIGRLSVGDVRRIEYWINNYPRRMLGYRTAQQVYSAV